MKLKNLKESFHTITLSKGTIFANKFWLMGKNADISKNKRVLILKSIFSENIYVVYLSIKFQISSITLTSFRQGVILPPTPLQNKPLKSPPGLEFRIFFENLSHH